MGFNDQETVALILLGHQYGRCHREVSGYEGRWWREPTKWNSDGKGPEVDGARLGYISCSAIWDWEYEENPCSRASPPMPLVQRLHKWPDLEAPHRVEKSIWTQAVRPHPNLAPGKRQYDDTASGEHIMNLVSDMCLTWDPHYRQHLHRYHRNRKDFRSDAIAAWKKLTELGCDGLLVEEATPGVDDRSKQGRWWYW